MSRDIRLITAATISGGEEMYERTVGWMEWASASGQLNEGADGLWESKRV